MDMLEQLNTCFTAKRKECQALNKKVKDLEESFDQLNATHEKTLEANEKLSNANIKLEKSIDQDKVKRSSKAKPYRNRYRKQGER